MLKVHNLNKKINGKTILKDVSFEIREGNIGVFLGGSGVGKSTLFRVLNHLESFDSGSFFLNETPLNLAKLSQEHIFGMVFQHFNLFEHLSVEENITLALIKVQKKEKKQALEIASILLKKYGLEDKAHLNVQKLSGGQKQRLAIARALALDPKIICMDEPTSALDPFLTDQVAEDIQKIAKSGRIVLVSTHDIALVEKLNATVFLMQSGSIVTTVDLKKYYQEKNAYPLLDKFLNPGR